MNQTLVNMELLDFFAGMALAGIWACPQDDLPPDVSSLKEYAKLAYDQAEAMLKERLKRTIEVPDEVR